MHTWLFWPISLIPSVSSRNANDLNINSLSQIMQDIHFFIYRPLPVNSVSGIMSIIQHFPLAGYMTQVTA